jgi:tetratricopeptide (TPR) repeat protein
MAYGHYLLENHTLIPDQTVFSWTPTDGSQIYCAWTAQILLYTLYKLGGLSFLFALRYLCLFFFLFIVWIYAKRNNIIYDPVTWLIVLIGSIMIQLGLQIKPELFSFVLMTLIVWTWLQVKKSPENGWKYCYLLPVIIITWMNTHADVMFGIAFLGLIFMGEVLNGLFSKEEMLSEQTRTHFFIAMFLCIIATFITPYGYHYPVYIVHNFFIKSHLTAQELNAVVAYKSIFYKPFRKLHFLEYLCLSLIIFSILLWPKIRDRMIDWTIIITTVFFCFLYIKFLRTTFFYPIIFIFYSFDLLSRYSTRSIHNKHYLLKLTKLTSILLFISIVILSNYEVLSSERFGFGIDDLSPKEEAEYIRNHLSGYRLGNDYDTGAYLLWALWPKNKIFIDTRYFPYRQWINEYIQLREANKEYWDKFFNKYKCDVWCVSLHTPKLYKYFLSSPDWRLVHYGPAACIFVSRGLKLTGTSRIVDKSILDINLYQLPDVLEFAISINDVDTLNGIFEKLKISPIIPYQRKLFVNLNNTFGLYLLSKNKFQDAIKVFSKSIEIDSNNPLIYCHLGYALMNNNDVPGAIKRYKDAIRIDPNLYEAQYNLGYLFLLSNSINNAILHYHEALRINSLDARAQSNLALAIQKKEQINNSITQIQTALTLQPNNVNALYSISVLYSYLGEYDKSINYLTSIMRFNPNNPNVYYNIACIYGKQNNVEESLRYLKMSISKGFKNWSILAKDSDLDTIRNTSYYKELIKSH